jgi:hypothetical protein
VLVVLSKRRGTAVVRRRGAARGAARRAVRPMMFDMASAIEAMAVEWRGGRGGVVCDVDVVVRLSLAIALMRQGIH